MLAARCRDEHTRDRLAEEMRWYDNYLEEGGVDRDANPTPGNKKGGLANIVALITIRLLGVKDMIIVNAMRVVISSLMRGMIFGSTFWISMGGVVLSSIVLIILDKLHSSLMFTSILSAIAHSAGQVIIVMFFYMQPGIAILLPYLFLGSIPMGILTGTVAHLVLKRIKPLTKNAQ